MVWWKSFNSMHTGMLASRCKIFYNKNDVTDLTVRPSRVSGRRGSKMSIRQRQIYFPWIFTYTKTDIRYFPWMEICFYVRTYLYALTYLPHPNPSFVLGVDKQLTHHRYLIIIRLLPEVTSSSCRIRDLIITLEFFFFSARTVNIWNSLPNYVVDVQSINVIKVRLDKFWELLGTTRSNVWLDCRLDWNRRQIRVHSWKLLD